METDPKLLELNGEALLPPTRAEISSDAILDNSWVKIAFMVPNADIADDTDIVNRYYSSASGVYTDTRLGCAIGINPKPQWTRYADIRVKGRLAGRNKVSLTNVSGNYGSGRAYSTQKARPV